MSKSVESSREGKQSGGPRPRMDCPGWVLTPVLDQPGGNVVVGWTAVRKTLTNRDCSECGPRPHIILSNVDGEEPHIAAPSGYHIHQSGLFSSGGPVEVWSCIDNAMVPLAA